MKLESVAHTVGGGVADASACTQENSIEPLERKLATHQGYFLCCLGHVVCAIFLSSALVFIISFHISICLYSFYGVTVPYTIHATMRRPIGLNRIGLN